MEIKELATSGRINENHMPWAKFWKIQLAERFEFAACASLALSSSQELGSGSFASQQMKDSTELAVGVSPTCFEFDCGYRCQLLFIAGV